MELKEYSWRDVQDISIEEGLLNGEIEFELTGDHEIELEDIPKSNVREMYSIAKELKENASAHASSRKVASRAPAHGREDPAARLNQLQGMLRAGLITQEEYDRTKAAILTSISEPVPEAVPIRFAGNELSQIGQKGQRSQRRDGGLLDRICTVVQSKMNTIMGTEDPRDALDVSYDKQLDLLADVRRSMAEFVTSKERIEQQKAQLQIRIDQLEAKAKEALLANREDLARNALEKRAAVSAQQAVLDRQIADLEDQQQKLMAAESRLAIKVDAFRTKKETIKAEYSAAEAQARMTESVTGISEEMADVGLAVQRAEEKTENMLARSAALDELMQSGTLTDLSGGGELEQEIALVKAESNVDDELARMKAEMNIKITKMKN